MRLALLDVATDRRVQEHAGALGRERLVHEPVDESVADRLCENRLVLSPARDDYHDVRELLDDLRDEGGGRRRNGGRVHEQHTAAAREQQVHRFLGGARSPDRVALADRCTDRVEQGQVRGKHEHVDHDRGITRLGLGQRLV